MSIKFLYSRCWTLILLSLLVTVSSDAAPTKPTTPIIELLTHPSELVNIESTDSVLPETEAKAPDAENPLGAGNSSNVCMVEGDTLDEAIANYTNHCTLTRSDCDFVNSKWYCSSENVGSNPAADSSANGSKPEPDSNEPIVNAAQTNAETESLCNQLPIAIRQETLKPWTYTIPTLAVFPEGEFDGERNYVSPPCGGKTWQIKFDEAVFWAKGAVQHLEGRNTRVKVAFWMRLPDFVAEDGKNGEQGGVIHYKWGVGFYPKVMSPNSGSGGVPSDGTNGWSVRDQAYEKGVWTYPTMPERQVGIQSYIYHTDMPGRYGDNSIYATVRKDKWFHMQKLLCLNSVNVNNGVIKNWINGELVQELRDLNFTNNEDLLSINRISILFYHGGAIASPSAAVGYVSDITLSLEQLLDEECR